MWLKLYVFPDFRKHIPKHMDSNEMLKLDANISTPTFLRRHLDADNSALAMVNGTLDASVTYTCHQKFCLFSNITTILSKILLIFMKITNFVNIS